MKQRKVDNPMAGWWDKVCPDCGRSFALYNEDDAREWYEGHEDGCDEEAE